MFTLGGHGKIVRWASALNSSGQTLMPLLKRADTRRTVISVPTSLTMLCSLRRVGCEAWGTSTRNVFWPVLAVMLAQPNSKRTRLAPCDVARASSTVMREPTSSWPHGSLRRQCSPSRESNCQTQLASGRKNTREAVLPDVACALVRVGWGSGPVHCELRAHHARVAALENSPAAHAKQRGGVTPRRRECLHRPRTRSRPTCGGGL